MLSSNHPSPEGARNKPLCIWIFHDQKPGHLSQLEGLATRLADLVDTDIHWLAASNYRLRLINFLFLPKHFKHLPKPDVILGAGHRTHLPVLVSGFHFHAFTTLIMKPSLPLGLFDAVICPKHDGLQESARVFNTFGPMNKVDQNLADQTVHERNLNLILIGGKSKHFSFDTKDILQQVRVLCQEFPEKNWLISNSPRTPADMNQALAALPYQNAHFFDYSEKPYGALQDILLKTQICWVTPDSMSMIFEALSAKTTIGLLECEPGNKKKLSRIGKQVKQLLEQNIVCDFKHRAKIANFAPQALPWAADNAAKWLIDAYKHWLSRKRP